MLVPNGLKCDVPECVEEFQIQVGSERRCFKHALERANEERAKVGKPPFVDVDDGLYVAH